jgi:Xaa-Pro aminopeptidase
VRRLQRLDAVREQLPGVGCDALVITHMPNVRYLCGFTGSAGILLVAAGDAVFCTDGRYADQARAEVSRAKAKIQIQIVKNSVQAAAAWLTRRGSLRRIGIEASHVTVAERTTLGKLLGGGRKIVAAPPVIERLRMVKDSDEVGKIRSACHLGASLFEKLCASCKPGAPEADAAAALEYAARKAGAEQMAFPTIIAGGKRSALPHGRASKEPLPRRGFVVCDFGVILAGYCSDMTRTLHVGVPSPEARAGYLAVREAQQAAVDAVKPGVTVGEVDDAARKLLSKRKLSRFFTHSTGHGVGLEIHEAPRIASGQKECLRPGMVITIEPGIYLPGKWGVRIEDTVVVTETGYEILTPCRKDLITL